MFFTCTSTARRAKSRSCNESVSAVAPCAGATSASAAKSAASAPADASVSPLRASFVSLTLLPLSFASPLGSIPNYFEERLIVFLLSIITAFPENWLKNVQRIPALAIRWPGIASIGAFTGQLFSLIFSYKLFCR